MAAYTPKTGARCGCKRGIQRDNCPSCEGTGYEIDFRAIHARRAEVARVRAIIEGGDENTLGPNGEHRAEMVACGVCLRGWDNARISSLTPAPSARCPFEYAHDEEG